MPDFGSFVEFNSSFRNSEWMRSSVIIAFKITQIHLFKYLP